MAHTQDFGIGRGQRVIVTRETTSQFDELSLITKPSVSDQLSSEQRFIKFESSYEQERKFRTDKRQTRSHQAQISGKKNVTWSLEGYAIPFNDGTTGNLTAPIYGYGPLLKMALGTQTPSTTPSRVEYTLSDAQAGLDVATIHNLVSDVYMEGLKSCWVEEFKITVQGGEEPKFMFSGGAQDMIITGFGEADGDPSGNTSIPIDDSETQNSVYSFENGSIVQIGTSSGASSVGHQVTAGGGTATLTVSPAVSAGQADDVDIIPYLPSGSTWPDECTPSSLQPINGILGTLNIAVATPAAGYDETGIPIVAFELTLKNNIKAVHNEAFRSTVRDIIPGNREVSGTISVILTKEQVKRLGHRKNTSFVTNDIAVSVGGALAAAGSFTVNIDRAEIGFSAVEVPEAEEVTMTLPFKALASSAGADELNIIFY